MNRDIKSNPLSYQDRLVRRSSQDIDSIVVHCTELPNLPLARRFGERIHHQESQTGNSGHFYIEKDGSIEQFIAPIFIANHVIGHNTSSIGIELVNAGRYPNWFQSDKQTVVDPYPDQQIQALVDLIHYITDRYPFVQNIAGHEDLDKTVIASEDNPNIQIKRKIDPGPLFPWDRVMAAVDLQRIRG